MRRAYLTIDEGTTNCKVLAVAEDGSVLAAGSASVPLHLPAPGHYEQDAAEIMVAVDAAIARCLERIPDVEILAVAISNQRESVLAFDRGTGEPLSPVIGWQDSRTSAEAATLATTELESKVRARTGLHLDAMYSATKMAWLAARLNPVEQGVAVISTLDAYLVHRLTGGETSRGDATNAARTLLLDLRTLTWDDELCAALGVPRGLLADVGASSGYYGETLARGALPAGIPILAVAGDSHAALFGQRCDEPGIGKVTFGTGSSVMVPTGSEFVERHSSVDTTLGYLTTGPQYAREGNVLASGAALEAMAGILRVSGGKELSELAGSAGTSHGLILVPAFSGLAAPHWDRDAVGTLVGLTRESSAAHVAWATMEAVAHQIADVVDEIQESGDAVTVLRADGGASVDPAMMQIQADLIGVPIQVSHRAEVAALGGARLAAYALGRGKEFDTVPLTYTYYEPTLTCGAREEKRAAWRTAVLRSRGLAVDSLPTRPPIIDRRT